MTGSKRNQKKTGPDSLSEEGRADALLDSWASRIKVQMPEDGDFSASLQHEPERGYFVSFRVETEGGIFIAEARDLSPERAVNEAGESIYQRLANSQGTAKPTFKDRIRELFSEAG